MILAGHPVDAGASCGLCGGGGARVRCTECGRRALCASCDDMYHRHPKRRNHQRLVNKHTEYITRTNNVHKVFYVSTGQGQLRVDKILNDIR